MNFFIALFLLSLFIYYLLKQYGSPKATANKLLKIYTTYRDSDNTAPKDALWVVSIEDRPSCASRSSFIVTIVTTIRNGNCSFRWIVAYIIAEENKKRIDALTNNNFNYFVRVLLDGTVPEDIASELKSEYGFDRSRILAFLDIINEIEEAVMVIPENY